MSKVGVHLMISLDGYLAGPNQSRDKPFGDGVEGFHDWLFRLKTFHEMLGTPGGDTGPSDTVMREAMSGVGAWILGRNMFGGGPGPWRAPAWNGWWGDNPPYHVPVFVVTHYEREPLVMEGGTVFHFVTQGPEEALRRARDAAGDKDVRIGGGANVVNQYLAMGAIDELELHHVPWIIGGGERLFAGLAPGTPRLEIARVVQAPDVTHVRYRVQR